MDDQLKRTIYETMSEVFETMFFTFLAPLHAAPQEINQSGDYVKGKISYSGEVSGEVSIYFPKALARYITVNFLGFEENAVEGRQVLDTVRETVNMSVGSLLGKLDPEGKCMLNIPEAAEMSGFVPESLIEEPGLCLFNTEFGLLLVVYKEK
ncbi:MAG: chemotaxis protein CheX [Proteobacteria bacterium]|nr:chemotaxis protein CheX [Pseudomonadota bacterium]MBU1708903.1 chemotaxis protein CheX [Pseudomonadota bacterium]